MPIRFKTILLAALLLLASGSLRADDKPKAAAEDPEVKMGREAHEELLKSGIKIIRDPKVVARVETIGKKIAVMANETPITASYGNSKLVKYDYQFFVIEGKDVNAFSLPGGFIYVYKGLLDYVQSDDELAGVLGHEVTHASHHHVAKLEHEQSRLNTQMLLAALATLVAKVPAEDAGNLLTGMQLLAIQKVNGFGQTAESDADHGGVILTTKAGYNPVGMLTFMERLARDEKLSRDVELGIFRTHPPSHERANAMMAQITALGHPINRRAVTNALLASTRPASEGAVTATELVLGGKVLYRSASPERAKQAADTINHLLDQDLQIYDVKKEGTTVAARGQMILTVQPEDAVLQQMSSADAVADQAYRTLRNALYKQILDTAY